MIRTFVFLTTVLLVLDCSLSEAQGFGNRWRSNSPSFGFRTGNSRHGWDDGFRNRFGYSDYGYAGNGGLGYPGTFPANGFGYVHDPYATGSFKAPDLLNDPFFRESTRYDSRFRGRHSPQHPPLQFRSLAAPIPYQPQFVPIYSGR